MNLERLDHLVLTVRDLAESVDFYTRVLGMTEVHFGQDRVALVFGKQKINLHLQGDEVTPKALHPLPGSADLCFLTRLSVGEIMETLERFGVKVINGPVARSGATGPILSVYFRDPDGNLIEVSHQHVESETNA